MCEMKRYLTVVLSYTCLMVNAIESVDFVESGFGLSETISLFQKFDSDRR